MKVENLDLYMQQSDQVLCCVSVKYLHWLAPDLDSPEQEPLQDLLCGPERGLDVVGHGVLEVGLANNQLLGRVGVYLNLKTFFSSLNANISQTENMVCNLKCRVIS